MKRGDVVLTILPFTDLSGQKRRPALIVSPHTRPGDDVKVGKVAELVPQMMQNVDQALRLALGL